MKLKVKKLKFLTGRPVCVLHENSAKKLSLHVGNRVLIENKNKNLICIVDTIKGVISKEEVAVSEDIIENLGLKDKETVNVKNIKTPHSINLIKNKLEGKKLKRSEIFEIIQNISNNSLTEVEIAFFVSAVYTRGMTLNEIKNLTEAMVNFGNKLKLNGNIYDKHSIGGVAGNRTTPIVVAICASAGLKIPKTSSRAITSAAGTADVIETVAKVDFSINKIKEIVKKTNACMVWGGTLGLSPTDDKIIKIEHIVNLDSKPQLVASILSKKISVGSKYILIDIPYGKSAKASKKQAEKLKRTFLYLAKKFKLRLEAVLTDGSEPIGNGIGPLLEMRDVIRILSRKNPPKDLEDKSVFLAGKLLEIAGFKNGEKKALEILNSGKALEKFKEIIKAQGGNIKFIDNLKPKFSYSIKMKKARIKHIDNKLINKLARIAGCPEDKAAGIYLHKKKNETVKNEPILTIYAVSKEKLNQAVKFYDENKESIVEVY